MAHHKRKRSRALSGIGSCNDVIREMKKRGESWRWYESTPSSHHIVFHHRPKRREVKRLEQAIVKGADPDDIPWPLAKKPHVYYW